MGHRSVSGYLLGIDAGQSAIKVVLFTPDGHQVHVVRVPQTAVSPQPRWQERDMVSLWKATARGIHRCLREAGVEGELVLGVGLCGHNDGLYLVRADGSPVRAAVLATDSRAHVQAAALGRGSTGAELLHLTGQVPFAGSPAALVAWLAENEPEALESTRWILSCKDWIRLQLTGEIATDRTDASASFADVHSGQWSPQAAAIAGLSPDLLPPILSSSAIAGRVSEAAASATGLSAGTPVATGSHDVDACALGAGAHRTGDASVILGTFSINQIVADAPTLDHRWQARLYLTPGRWLHMATSAAGTTNVDRALAVAGMSTGEGTAAVIDRVLSLPRGAGAAELTYLPFLLGAPPHAEQDGIGAGLLGMRAWHTQQDLIRAVVEGVVHNHRMHIDALRDAFPIAGPVTVCGGGARSIAWTGLLADSLGVSVQVSNTDEAGARGAALLAGVAVDVYRDLDDAVAQAVRIARHQEPGDGAAEMDQAYERYVTWLDALVAAGSPARRRLNNPPHLDGGHP